MEAINQSQQQQPVVGTVWSTVMLEPNQAVLQPIFDKKGLSLFVYNLPNHDTVLKV